MKKVLLKTYDFYQSINISLVEKRFIFIVGVEFNSESYNIVGYKWERV